MIRELRDGDVEAFVELRREALLDSPLAFVASLDDDVFSSPGTVREQLRGAPESVIIGAFKCERKMSDGKSSVVYLPRNITTRSITIFTRCDTLLTIDRLPSQLL